MTEVGAPGHLLMVTLAYYCSAGKSSSLPLMPHEHPWFTQDSRRELKALLSLHRRYRVYCLLCQQLSWQSVKVATISGQYRNFASPENMLGEGFRLKPVGHLDRPHGGAFIRAIPSHQNAFWWENNKQNPPFPIKPISYYISKSFGIHVVIKYKENGFINSSPTLCQETWTRKQGKTCLGSVLSSDCPCGWNPVWESRIHRYRQMYTQEKVNLFQATFPTPSSSPSSQAYLLLTPKAFSAVEPGWPRLSQNMKRLPGIKEKLGTSKCTVYSSNVQEPQTLHASPLTIQPSNFWGRREPQAFLKMRSKNSGIT